MELITWAGRGQTPVHVPSVLMPSKIKISFWWPWVSIPNPSCSLLEKMVKRTYRRRHIKRFSPIDGFLFIFTIIFVVDAETEVSARLHLAEYQFCKVNWPTQRWKWKLWPHKLLQILGRSAYVWKPEILSGSSQKTTTQHRLINIFKLLQDS